MGALESVDRSKTPWVVVVFHTPWYSSSEHHYLEGYKAKQDMEKLLYQNGVDLVVNGHVHAYERSYPVYNDTLDACGATHIVVGDGGNYEGPALPWREPQPAWSAFREGSFRAGVLSIENETHAKWEWRRTACVQYNGKTRDGKTRYVWNAGPDGSEACSTFNDNSAQAYEAVDFATLERNVRDCANRPTS